ncbi:hypothetical protein STCU_11946 [Strigomonas culicis]|uniref:Uncharacterized protein n=1 Tax=Strigomonas culicis TaxID=28005 RepID=S9TC11_9TRYP|nr:hypothetical protein STCU_11946 [Strigomonas culicis]|eukprot:EPY15537.1 hypothetical protein STCU_11946 [Strigomonas culicis]
MHIRFGIVRLSRHPRSRRVDSGAVGALGHAQDGNDGRQFQPFAQCLRQPHIRRVRLSLVRRGAPLRHEAHVQQRLAHVRIAAAERVRFPRVHQVEHPVAENKRVGVHVRERWHDGRDAARLGRLFDFRKQCVVQ